MRKPGWMNVVWTLGCLGAAFAVAACEEPRDAAGVAHIDLVVDATALDPGASALFDVSYFDAWGTCERVGARVEWRAADGDRVSVALPCTPGKTLESIRVTLVGSYLIVPAAVDGPESFRCPDVGSTSARTFHVRLGSQGFLDIAMNSDSDGVGLGWLLGVASERTPSAGWSRRVTTDVYGNGVGAVSYVGPCGLGAPGSEELVTVSVAPAVDVRPVPTEPEPVGCGGINIASLNLQGLRPRTEFWPLPDLTRRVSCAINEDTFVPFGPLSIARVAREAYGTRASFARMSCAADWACGDAPALSLSCTPDPAWWAVDPELAGPALYLDDLRLKCPGASDLAIDATANATLREADVEGRPLLTWIVAPDLDPATVAGRGCTLSARATVASSDGKGLVDGSAQQLVIPAGAVYPILTWDVPADWATAEGCTPARLATSGPIGLVYTSPKATEDKVFAYRAASGATLPR